MTTTQIDDIRWFHSIELPSGRTTPGYDDTPSKVHRLHLPDLAGKSVLDIGAWDGFYSFEAERRGASRVLATDSFVWQGRTWGSKAGFEYAREALASRVEDQEIDVMDLSPDAVGTFDVTLCLGVLYHMKHPLLMLERVASVTDGLLILETETWHGVERYPVVRYFLDGDDWCAPNLHWLRAALREVGFRDIRVVWKVAAPLRLVRSARRAVRLRQNILHQLGRGRVVIHAWR